MSFLLSRKCFFKIFQKFRSICFRISKKSCKKQLVHCFYNKIKLFFPVCNLTIQTQKRPFQLCNSGSVRVLRYLYFSSTHCFPIYFIFLTHKVFYQATRINCSFVWKFFCSLFAIFHCFIVFLFAYFSLLFVHHIYYIFNIL